MFKEKNCIVVLLVGAFLNSSCMGDVKVYDGVEVTVEKFVEEEGQKYVFVSYVNLMRDVELSLRRCEEGKKVILLRDAFDIYSDKKSELVRYTGLEADWTVPKELYPLKHGEEMECRYQITMSYKIPPGEYNIKVSDVVDMRIDGRRSKVLIESEPFSFILGIKR